jgi:hypothetical protein
MRKLLAVDHVTMKHDVPQPATSGQFFYVADDGSLSRRDPNQPQLPSMEDQQK